MPNIWKHHEIAEMCFLREGVLDNFLTIVLSLFSSSLSIDIHLSKIRKVFTEWSVSCFEGIESVSIAWLQNGFRIIEYDT